MPRERGESISKARENLTDFGKLFYEICDYLGTSMSEMANLAGISEALISKNTRIAEDAQTYSPTRKTVVRIYEAFEYLADKKRLWLIPEIKEAFFNADPAMQGTPEQAMKARRVIGQMQQMTEQAARRAMTEKPPRN